ncbi:hypothetical protein GCM10009596_04000 [Arthrobacter rhombi]|uniref:hypothetical protein n=1 Tax=Arthrobacter rhombi TaxID=71253 RepID=UPI0031DF6726
MSVSTASLPEKLPDTGAIDTAAAAVRKVGTKSHEIRKDVQSDWSGLEGVFKSPHQALVYSAVKTVMKPYTDAVKTLTNDTATALEDFSSDISGLKQRYDDVKKQASAHNALEGDDRPDDYGTKNADIQAEINAVSRLYDDAVKDCANTISTLNPLVADLSKPAGTVGGLSGDAKNALEILGVTTKSLEFRDRKIFFKYNSEANVFSEKKLPRKFSINEGTLKKLGVPNSYIERLVDSQKPSGDRVSKNAGKKMLHNLDPKSPLGALVAKYPWLKNTKYSVDGRKVTLKASLTRGPGQPGRHAAPGPARLPKAFDKVNKLANGPAGKILSGVGIASTFAGTYTEGYNDSLIRNPDMTPGEHRAEAAKDAAIVTGAEQVGSVVGTAVGRGAGAAIGQAIIPIPGVGAAVGGFLGGLAGGYVGGVVGNAIGSTINDIRHGDIGSVGEAVKDTGKKVLSSLNPFD